MVVAVVLAGPALIACSQSAEGMGACLRQRVVEAGLLHPDQVETAVASPQAEPVEPEPQAPAPAAAPEPAPEPSVAAAAPELTLLRAEPDGSLVIAGTGRPGARIDVFANGEPLGTTTAEPSGDWVVVPEAPLAPGGVEISVGEAGTGALGEQSFVVVIDPDRTAEPLVVATRPGEASAVLQGLPQPEPAPADVAAAPEPEPAVPEPEAVPAAEPEPAVEPPPQVAAVEPEPEAEAEPAAPSRSTAEPSATVEPAPAAEPEAPDTSVATVEPEVAEPEPAPVVITPPSIDAIEIDGSANFFAGGGSEGATVRLYVDDQFIADAMVAGGRWLVETANVLTKPAQRVRVDMLKPGTAEVAARAEVNFVVELPVAAPEPPAAVKPTTPEPEPAPRVEVAEPAPPPPSKPAIVAEPSDRALDPAADAAATPPPARDLAATPDAAPAAGAERDLSVAAEAEPSQPAERDLGAAEKPASEVAAVPDLAQPPKVAVPPEDKAIETADVPDAALGTPMPKPLAPSSKPAPEPEPAPVVPVPGPAPETAAEPEPEPEAAPAAPAKPAAPAVEAKPVAPATTTALPAQPAAPDAPEAATTAAAPPDEDAIPTLRAVPVGDPEAMRFASGKAIIRRGDNLWSIARRVYGSGIKYTTIYRANDDQIRNPHRIYPGQVFDLPGVDDE
jgi:nucleoid-associated protein YgaU